MENKERSLKALIIKIHDDLQKERGKTEQLEIPQLINTLQEEVTKKKSRTMWVIIFSLIADISDKQKSFKQITDELTKGVRFYKERLGLEFQRIGGTLSVEIELAHISNV